MEQFGIQIVTEGSFIRHSQKFTAFSQQMRMLIFSVNYLKWSIRNLGVYTSDDFDGYEIINEYEGNNLVFENYFMRKVSFGNIFFNRETKFFWKREFIDERQLWIY